MKNKKVLKTKRKGFTLVELLTTIAILSLLFIVLGVIVINVIDSGKAKSTKITWASIKEIAVAYILESDNIKWLKSDINSTDVYTCTTVQHLINKGFLKNNLVDANTGNKIEGKEFIKITKNDNAVLTSSTDGTDVCDTEEIEFTLNISGPNTPINEKTWYYDSDDDKVVATIENVITGESGAGDFTFEISKDSDTISKTVSSTSENKFELSSLIDSGRYYSFGSGVKVCVTASNGHGNVNENPVCYGSNINLDFTTPEVPEVKVCNSERNDCNDFDSSKWYTEELTLKISGGGSSPSGINYEYSDNDSEEYSKLDGQYIENIDSTREFRVRAVNGVGKTGQEKEIKLEVDTSAPFITFNVLNNNWSYSKEISGNFVDNGSGLASYQINNSETPTSSWITIDGSPVGEEVEFSKTVTSDGTFYVHVKDNAGGIRTGSISVENIDTVFPTCTYTPDYSTWTSSDRFVEYGCSDSDSGCDPSNSGNSIIINSSMKTYAIPDEYTIKDNAGNEKVCSVKTIYVRVDKSEPTAPILTASDGLETGVSHSSSFSLTVSGGGNSISGIYYEYRVNSDSVYSKVEDNIISNITNSGYTYYVRTCNNAGTCSGETDYNVVIEKVPDAPILTASDNVPSGGWHNSKNFTLYIDKDNNRTDVNYKYYFDYQNGSSSSEKDIDNSDSDKLISVNSNYAKIYVRACYKDNEKCSGYAEYISNIDTSIPCVPVAIASDNIVSNQWHIDNFDLEISPQTGSSLGCSSNSPSGIYYKYTIDDGAEIKLEVDENKIAYIKDISESGIYTYKFWTCTNAGTCSDSNNFPLYRTSTYIVSIDKDDPVISNITKSPTSITDEVTISATLSDAPSGIAEYKCTTESNYTDSNWNTTNIFNPSLNFSKTSNGTYYIWAKDAVGHYARSSEIEVTNIDDEGPEFVSGYLDIDSNFIYFKDVTFKDESNEYTVYYYLGLDSSEPSLTNIKETNGQWKYGNCGVEYYGWIRAVDKFSNSSEAYYIGNISIACSGSSTVNNCFPYGSCAANNYLGGGNCNYFPPGNGIFEITRPDCLNHNHYYICTCFLN